MEVPIPVYYTPDSEDCNYKTNNITKLRLWFNDVSMLHDINEHLMEKFPVFAVFNSDYGTVPSRAELKDCHGFIEVIPLESGKSSAIKFLAQEEGLSPQEIVTIGDGLNDLGMVRDFDGYAIENSGLSIFNTKLKTTPSLAKLVEEEIK